MADDIWSEVALWDSFAKKTIGSQFVRATHSISANIAEGYGRYYYKESKQFYFYSRGSLLESVDWLTKAKNRKLITIERFNLYNEQLEVLHKRLNAYIKRMLENINK